MFNKYSFKSKLLICFLLLSCFALVTGSAGVYVLELVRNSFDESVESASKGIALQSELSSYLVKKRDIIDRVKSAESQKQLNEVLVLVNQADQQIQYLQTKDKSSLEINVKGLLEKKMDFVETQDLLNANQSEIIELLASVNPRIDGIVANEIAKAIDMLNSSIDDFSDKSEENAGILQEKFSILANVSESSLDTLEGILDVRAGVYYLSAKCKNIFLFDDIARINYTKNEINTELARIKEIVSDLNADDSLAELSVLIDTLEEGIPRIVAVRTKAIENLSDDSSSAAKKDINYSDELEVLEKLIEKIDAVVWSVADNIGFDAILKIEDATDSVDSASLKYSEDIKGSLNNLATIIKSVVARMQIAEDIKASLATLNSNVRDVMLAVESSGLDLLQVQINDVYKQITSLYKKLAEDDGQLIPDNLLAQIEKLITVSRHAIEAQKDVNIEIAVLSERLEKVDHDAGNMAKSLQDQIESQLAKTSGSISGWQYILIAIASGSFIIALVLGSFISRVISRRINNVTSNLSNIVSEVGDTVLAIQTVSQDYSSGASSQAAGLQETIASLLEMTASIKQSAGSSKRANGLVGQAADFAGSGYNEVSHMTGVMKEINTDSRDTSVVINTINEIAFQTNLLALNAAVEAARAGEAGKGFAVVAEEVRNLAMKAAEAANSTSQMLESAIAKTEKGVEVSDKIASLFENIVSSIDQTNVLMDEIAQASSGQDVDIENIKNAVVKMDQVTQHNAALAQETATSAESLNANVEVLNETISDLMAFVKGE